MCNALQIKKIKNLYDFFFFKHCQFAWEIVEFQSLEALPIWRFLDNFSLEKILWSTRTLDCDKYTCRLKMKGKFFSFCWAIFLYFSTPISWVMSYNKKCPRFVDHLRQWVNQWKLMCYFKSIKRMHSGQQLFSTHAIYSRSRHTEYVSHFTYIHVCSVKKALFDWSMEIHTCTAWCITYNCTLASG